MSLAKKLPQHIPLDGGRNAVPVVLSVHPQARYMKLAVDPITRSVRLTVPKRCRSGRAVEFFTERQDWVRQEIANWPDTITLTHGSVMPILGESLILHYSDSLRGLVTQEGCRLIVPGVAESKERRIRHYINQRLLQLLEERVPYYCSKIDRTAGKIRIRSMRSRWGSCSEDADLTFNWRLAFAPIEVANYVAAHEVAHFIHMDHSPAFWKLAEKLQPGHQPYRDWLKHHGAGLFSYRLGE